MLYTGNPSSLVLRSRCRISTTDFHQIFSASTHWMKVRWRMLFKLGLTVIVLIAIYMFYAINDLPDSAKENENLDGNHHSFHGTGNQFDPNKVEEEGNRQSFHSTGNQGDPNKGDEVHAANSEQKSKHWTEGIHISVVACGDRQEESLIMLKSAAIFSKSLLVFHIFAEDELQKGFQEQLDFWPRAYRERAEYHIYNISFPPSPPCKYCKGDVWKDLFKPCACQRLFIPDLLKEVDALLYLDTDILFLSPVEDIWSFFNEFNSTQLAGVSPESEDKATGWYNRFAMHPYYGLLGINSGVMLMNLTRMRASTWLQSMKDNLMEYKLKITFGDQDLINIYFSFHPDQLFVFPCEWNYRPDHCMYMSVCKRAEKTGAFILHGSRGSWHNEKQPAFKAVYRTFKNFHLGSDSIQFDLLRGINSSISMANSSNCGKLPHLFMKRIETFLQLD